MTECFTYLFYTLEPPPRISKFGAISPVAAATPLPTPMGTKDKSTRQRQRLTISISFLSLSIRARFMAAHRRVASTRVITMRSMSLRTAYDR